MENYLNNNDNTEYEIESSDTIKEQVSLIVQYVKKNKRHIDFRKNVSTQFFEFENKYPTLFRKLVEEDCDQQQLNFMLSKLDQVRTGTQSQHDASVVVGQVLVDKYVKPELAKKEQQR